MKTNQEIQDMKKDCAKAIGEVTDGSNDVYKGWIEALNWVTMTNEQPEPRPHPELKPRSGLYPQSEDDAFEEGFKQGKLVQKKYDEDDKLSDGLQKYIDGVALNILYRNYHKSTNGIWSRAEVDEHLDDGDGEFWMVDVDFGCQDDTRNEQYRERITVNKDKDGKWTMLGLTYPNVIDGVEGSNFCDCGNTYEWVCKHECPNDRPSTAHPKYKEKV